MQQPLAKRYLYLASLVISLGCFALWLAPPKLVFSLAASFSDKFYQFNPRTPPSQLVFIDIENTSVKQLGRWPWPRQQLAEGLAKLYQAEVVGLDMVFSEATQPEEDLALAEVLASLPAIGGLFLNGPLASQLSAEAEEVLSFSALYRFRYPQLIASQQLETSILPLLEATRLVAGLNIQPDPDQLLRHYPLAFQVADLVIPNLATQMWRWVQQEDLQFSNTGGFSNKHLAHWVGATSSQPLVLGKQATQKLNYYANNAWQRLTFAELLQPSFNPASLQGKWVLVGISEAGVSDLRATPLGHLPGPLIHLTQLANQLDASSLTLLPNWAKLALLGISALALLLVLKINLVALRLLLAGGLALAAYGLALGLYVYFSIWLEVFYLYLTLLLGYFLGEAWLFMHNKAETSYIKNAFASYLPPALVNKLVEQKDELKLGGNKQEITVIFTDLRNFTPTTEALETQELVSHLNNYFGLMINQLHAHQGTLDKLIGDALMGLFNAPLADPDHPYNACLAAAAMCHALVEFNANYQHSPLHQLQMGIGINTGEAVVGNLGAAGRFNYTALGDTVNLAARLEGATKEVNQQLQAGKLEVALPSIDILIGEQTYAAIKGRLPCYYVGELSLKGKSQAVNAWALAWQEVNPS